MDFSADAVERAICQFYQSYSKVDAQSHEWLEKAKNSPQAWVFVWELLHPQKSSEVQFFAANTLHIKIKKSLNELSLESITALKEQLMTRIAAYSMTGLKLIINKLCISLSTYLIHMCPEKWPDALPAIITIFTPENLPQVPPDKILLVLFEILTVLPEEFSSMHLEQHHKGLLKHHLIEHTSLVVSLIEKVMSTNTNEDVILQALECAASWIAIGVPITEYHTLYTIVLNLIFSTHKQHKRICEKSLEFLKVVIDLPENVKYPSYLFECLGKILSLGDIITQELAMENSGDRKLICNIYNLFLTFGGTHAKQCLNWIKESDLTRQKVLILISHILQCSGAKGYYPKDETYSRLTFGFWYSFQDELICATDFEFCMRYLGPIYKELVNVLIVKAQIPGVEQNYTKQDLESFRCYRQDISDTLMYCYGILHETTFFLIQSKLNEINVNESKWQELEACLFSLCSISENMDSEENQFLPPLFEYIRNLPFERLNTKVLSTALDTIGAYAGWMSTHGSSLQNVLPVIILGLSIPETTSNATMALKDVARDCQYNIKSYSSLILDASQKALQDGRLRINDSQRLMSTVGLLLSSLPQGTILEYLNVILTPYMNRLNSLSVQERSSAVKNEILTCLKMVGVLSATLNTKAVSNSESQCAPSQLPNAEPQPVLLILQKLFPIIRVIANFWSSDEQVMQSLFILLKQAVTTLLEDVQSMVTEILDFIVSVYRINPLPSALDLSKTVSTLFGKDEKYQPMMQTLTNELCSVAMANLSSPSALLNRTDLVEALFLYLTQIIKKAPKLIMCTDTTLLFQCAIFTLTVPELSTVKSASAFLVIFINQSRELEDLTRVVNAYGEKLVQQIISCIGGESSRSNIEPLAGILLALNRNYCESHSHWLRRVVTENICPRSTLQQRENFISTVLRCQRNKEQLQETIRKFSFICRGIIGTEYAQCVTPYF